MRERVCSVSSWAGVGIILTSGVVIVILALVLSDRRALGVEQTVAWPAAEWIVSTPEEQGLDPARLEEMVTLIDEHDLDVHSIIVVRNGQIAFEDYASNDYADRADINYSVTKSVTSLLVGIALEQGYIESVDTPLSELLPDYDFVDTDPRKERLTLEDLLTMTPGLDWPEHGVPYDDPDNIVRQMWSSRDPVHFVLERPMPAHQISFL